MAASPLLKRTVELRDMPLRAMAKVANASRIHATDRGHGFELGLQAEVSHRVTILVLQLCSLQ